MSDVQEQFLRTSDSCIGSLRPIARSIDINGKRRHSADWNRRAYGHVGPDTNGNAGANGNIHGDAFTDHYTHSYASPVSNMEKKYETNLGQIANMHPWRGKEQLI